MPIKPLFQRKISDQTSLENVSLQVMSNLLHHGACGNKQVKLNGEWY